VALETVEEVFRLYQEQYRDFNVRHFHEKLRDEHQIEISYTWLYQALVGAGLVQKRRRRAPHRRRRERRPLPGMLLHIDGSKHRWFQDDRWYDLIVILDDATSQIYYAQLVEEESTRTVMRRCGRSSSPKACSARFIAIAAATSSLRPRRVKRWTKRG
jgi:hypothetical protein